MRLLVCAGNAEGTSGVFHHIRRKSTGFATRSGVPPLRGSGASLAFPPPLRRWAYQISPAMRAGLAAAAAASWCERKALGDRFAASEAGGTGCGGEFHRRKLHRLSHRLRGGLITISPAKRAGLAAARAKGIRGMGLRLAADASERRSHRPATSTLHPGLTVSAACLDNQCERFYSPGTGFQAGAPDYCRVLRLVTANPGTLHHKLQKANRECD